MSANQSIVELSKNTYGVKQSDVNSHLYDVVIVGAGPVGVATAIGLQQRGITNILVLDQTRAFRQVGQVIDLLPNGLKSLKYLDNAAYEAVKKASITLSNPQPRNDAKWLYKNIQGQTIRSISLSFDDWVQNYGEGRLSISWYNLQTALRNLLPEAQVKSNHRCLNIADEPENGCIRVDCVSDATEINPYAYWQDVESQNSETTSQQLLTTSFRTKLIVAADGINSTIRQILYKDSIYQDFAKPVYSGFAAISCRDIVDIPKEVQTELVEKFLQGSPIVTICHDEITKTAAGNMQDTRILLFCRGKFGYVIHLPIALETVENQSGSTLIDLAWQTLKKAEFPDAIQQLVRSSPPENMEQRPYYVHHVMATNTNEPKQIQAPWSLGRVVLVGDAVHGMPPFMAQGANQGLEDAIAIVTLIAKIAKEHDWDKNQAITTAFQKYESLRRPIMAYVQEATLKRLPYSSDKDWQHYSQLVYQRNFDQILETLL